MAIALAMAGVGAAAIGYVHARATSTPVGDAAELAALEQVFGPGAGGTPVGSTKSATGHMPGAAGAIEAIFSILAIQNRTLPPSQNLDQPMSEAKGFNLLSDAARPAAVDHVLSNAFGIGGVNAALVFSRHQ
jgi:3-oxoacyl-[acyl-carrier-protein] synthase II